MLLWVQYVKGTQGMAGLVQGFTVLVGDWGGKDYGLD
jgi:hypothetical protein